MRAAMVSSPGGASLSPPVPALQQLDGGLYVPKRSLDRWSMGSSPAITVLNGAIDNVQTSITVRPTPGNGTTAATFPQTGRYLIVIGTEQMLVTAGAGTLVWTVARGVNSTAAAAHADAVTVNGDSVFHIVAAGDSTVQSTVGASDEWPVRLARQIGRTLGGGLLGRGFWPLWRSDNNALIGGGAGNSANEWSQSGTAWALVGAGGITDQYPFGWGLTANGAAQVLIWTRPANVTVAAIQIVGSGNCSYSTDGGTTWVDAALGALAIARLKIAIANPTDFRIRAANAAGAATSPQIGGIIVWSTNPTFGTTQGVMLHNLGKDADFLSVFARANALGDDFGMFDGFAGSIYPALVILGPFTNDIVSGGPGYGNYAANLTTVVNRVKPYADVLLLSYCEQNPAGGRASSDQTNMRALVQQVAVATNSAHLNLYDAFAAEGDTGYDACNADGLMGTNNHCSQLGDNDIAARIMRALSLTTL